MVGKNGAGFRKLQRPRRFSAKDNLDAVTDPTKDPEELYQDGGETCGRTHGGVCYRATGACFNCGGSGHFAKDCTSPRRSGSFTTSEGSAQVSAPRGSQSAARGRGRGRGPGNTPGSQSTVNQPASSGAPVRVYTMRQREEAETSDVVAVEKNIGKEPEETSRG
ncbi:uncharacterized protein LOC131169359 [Hevea brasiliensis]|uniref:uncharacterized protein LOC131169359 n=1 Tax=Hevea brasiliensis TaxID=3981 RepID=UPI0025F126B8|nr:uncharacterized protein LOC131169359 [Hevea brasiliensis]